ncbi:LANO_0D06854g1_1 [Lachancea nothofagi CBS 11611]|uniref:LANO_0D06854g1_1 n=1 Tax=Lachancea nothofagi CBS 11611 TaxID=1266666 RepID=A0A1G4JHM8_9SACH|nr:LANO_0D06854g1_1 [Lachancea nothofagi CBS 11611]
MAYAKSLSGLTTREEIVDVVYRVCLALDSNDKALWESAWARSPDITLDIGGNVSTGLEKINAGFDSIGPMDTQHLVSSVRVDVKDGSDKAHVTANALAQHFRAGQGQVPNADHLLVGSTYDIQIVKQADGAWKLKTWVLKVTWTEGTWDVMPQS